MADLPWAPAAGQTSLRVIERSDAFVICEDARQIGLRTMWTLDGALRATGGKTLTLKARPMKAEPIPEPEPPPQAAPIATKSPKGRKPETAQLSLF